MTLALTLLLLGQASAATNVCGTLATNTTWTAAGSPYVVTCTTTLSPTATLTVDPGVSVFLDPNVALQIGGELQVNGTLANPVLFDRNVVSQPWAGLSLLTNQGGHAVIDHATIHGATTGVSVECCFGHPQPAILTNVVLTNHDTALGGYAGNDVRIEDSELAFNGVAVSAADKYVKNSWIHDNAYGVALGSGGGGAERIDIEGCVIDDNGVGVWGSNSVTTIYSSFTGNSVAVRASSNASFTHNDLTGNGTGVEFYGGASTFTLNNVFGNTTWNALNNAGSTVNAPNNWWGTTNTSVIDTTIFDLLDNPLVGLVNYATPALTPVLTTYLPPLATSIGWSWTNNVSLGVDLTCNATDNGAIVSVAWTVVGPTGTTTNTTTGLTWSWVAPVAGVYTADCRVTDDTGLHDDAPTTTFWVAADADLDGVIDPWDACPATPAGSAVDDDGCPVTCVPATYASGTLTIPALWLPSGQCVAVSLTGPLSGLSIASLGPCQNACAPAAYAPVTNTVILPEVTAGPNEYTAVFQKVGPTLALQSFNQH